VAAGAIEEQVQALLELHRPELARLVDQALEAELARLVDERIAARNGNGNTKRVSHVEAVKVCSGPCARTLPLSAFEKGRGKCRECRRAEHRARGHDHGQAAAEPPRTG
jgi:hypothetical protein